jgi:hypothetical protein
MQHDGVGRTSTGGDPVPFDLDSCELAFEPQHDTVDSFVCDEQVRAEADDRNRTVRLLGELERLLELANRPRP